MRPGAGVDSRPLSLWSRYRPGRDPVQSSRQPWHEHIHEHETSRKERSIRKTCRKRCAEPLGGNRYFAAHWHCRAWNRFPAMCPFHRHRTTLDMICRSFSTLNNLNYGQSKAPVGGEDDGIARNTNWLYYHRIQTMPTRILA